MKKMNLFIILVAINVVVALMVITAQAEASNNDHM